MNIKYILYAILATIIFTVSGCEGDAYETYSQARQKELQKSQVEKSVASPQMWIKLRDNLYLMKWGGDDISEISGVDRCNAICQFLDANPNEEISCIIGCSNKGGGYYKDILIFTKKKS